MNACETRALPANTVFYGDDRSTDDSGLPFEFGTVLEDPNTGNIFTLLDFLGSGSYAVVYRARDEATGSTCALKCLSKLSLSEEMLALQKIEVSMHQAVGRHQNIVQLESFFETSDWLFLVLEYCEGEDLFNWINRNADYQADGQPGYQAEIDRLRTIKLIFDQILDAVLFCHQNSVYHRDLKPENFMVTRNGVVKLTDFGLATAEEYSTDYECGSKPYLSYESRNFYRAPYSSRQADIWSLGIIFLNLLYHQCPWDDPSAGESEVFASFMKDKVSFLRQKFECPREVAEFLATQVFCLESDHGRKGRINLLQWKCWCTDLVKNYVASFFEETWHDGSIDIPAHRSRQEEGALFSAGESSKSSWTEDLDDDEEMDFNEPVHFDDEDYDSAYGSFSMKSGFSHEDDIAAALEDEFGSLQL
ncbi:kinase-like protein [Basidiobolus meristosporus CBS 931.73]|uniref:non-specific serine/threonine protein kinase n=1 Tax=Basidiobolus meristosporus CBS 931.73 TaxID=1314790 RepID=A0A1Y1XUN4_9FUNG|nr:kinase-like protein [Basidiobolus meristosporus CBS 931.73]|eukprot:ORX89395.1 kinase-like protein [Basidiobolus meristosporus CBS 931.73]